MDDPAKLLEDLSEDLERLNPEVLEVDEQAELLSRKHGETSTIQQLHEEELAKLVARIANEQKDFNDLEEQLSKLKQEYELRQQHLQTVDNELENDHKTFEANQSQQLAICQEMQDMFDIDDRVQKLEAQKQDDVQSILDIHTSHQTAMQSNRMEQEEEKSANAIEVLNTKLQEQREKQAALKKALASANDIFAMHCKKEDQCVRSISQCTRAIHQATVEDQEVSNEVKRLRDSGHLEDLMERMNSEQTSIGKLEAELETLEKQIGVERKSIVAMRNVLRDNLNYLWETKAELHTQLWNFREKTDKLQENIDGFKEKEEGLKQNVKAISTPDVSEIRLAEKAKKLEEKKLKCEELDGLIAQAQVKVEEQQHCRTRAQERVDMAQRDLARYGKSKGLEQILDKMIQALDRVDADCKAAEAELAGLEQQRQELEAVEPAKQPAPQLQNGSTEQANAEQAEIKALTKDLSKVQKKLTNCNTRMTDSNMMVKGLYTTMQQAEKEVASIKQTLASQYDGLIAKCTRRTQAAHELALRQMNAKSLAMHTDALSARLLALEKQLAELGPHSKEQRKLQNEMTTKLAQSRLRMGNQEKHRDKQLRDLMACNYEVYLAEAETKVNWFKMKLLTKDIHDVKEALELEEKRSAEHRAELEERSRLLQERRAQWQQLQQALPTIKKAVTKTTAELPRPLASVCAKHLQIQDAQERFEVLQPFLSDLALRHAEVEQEIAELQEQQNSHTVESALNSPSVTGGSRPPSVSAFAC
uniref:Uncharacterized protein n=1 Tax=Eutreptiella gymnastica TaxID=73025 RepID=A0A7S4G655_9EUGL